jgi:hypothetical protein
MGWTLTKEVDIELGATIASALARPWDWVHRISETISCVGIRRVRRQVRVEMEILEGFVTKDPGSGIDVALVPLLFISKTALVALDCVDESGATLATLTSDESAFVSWSALMAATEADLGRQPSPSLADKLRTVAWGSATDASRTLSELASGVSGDSDDWHLLSRGYSAKLVGDLADNTLLLLVLPDVAPRRRIATVSYDEPFGDRSERHSLSVRMGWRPARTLIPVPAVSNCRSYDVEVEAPDGLEVAKAVLVASRKNGTPRIDPQTNAANRVHLELSRVDPGSVGQVDVNLRAPRDGFLTAACISSVLSAVLVVMAACISQRITTLVSNADAMVALLLAIPAYMLANLARTGEHAMVSRLLSGARGAMLLSALSLYAAAGAVVLSISGTAFSVTLYALASIATVCATVLVGAMWRR